MIDRLSLPALLGMIGAFTVAFTIGFVLVPLRSHATHVPVQIGHSVEFEQQPVAAAQTTVPPTPHP